MATQAPAPAAPKAAIAVPRTFNLQAIAQAITGAKLRIEAIERALSTASGAAGVNVLQQQVTNLNLALQNLQQRVIGLENAGDSEILVMTASGAIDINDPVFPTGSSTCESLVDGDPVKIFGVIGLAVTSAGAGQAVRVRRRGYATIAGASFDTGRAVYASQDGITQYPSYNDTVLQVGVAVSATGIWVSIGLPLVAAPGFDPGYEDFMAVPYRIVADAIGFMNTLNSLEPGVLVNLGAGLVTTRVLQEGTHIAIQNPDGVAGDPVIEYEPAGVVLPAPGVAHLVGLAPTVVVA